MLLLATLAESLAGRMGILRLHLLAPCELAGRRQRLLDTLFAGAFKTRKAERLGKALAERVAAGGYPAALARPSARRRGSGIATTSRRWSSAMSATWRASPRSMRCPGCWRSPPARQPG